MMKQEFENRVKMQVSVEEYDAIEVVYINSDLEKNEFCKMWAKVNAKRIKAYQEAMKAKEAENKRISYLFSVMNYLREQGYRYSFGDSVEKHLNLRMTKALQEAGIEYTYCRFDEYQYETISSLIYSIQQYINKAAA